MAVASDIYSCKMRAKWDYSTTTTQGKHTEFKEIYLLNAVRMANVGNVEADYGFEVVERKNKIRGMGNSLILRFESTPGKDFEILGWALEMSATSQG